MNKADRKNEKDMYWKPASVMPIDSNHKFSISMKNTMKKQTKAISLDNINLDSLDSSFEFDKQYLQKIRPLTDPVLRNAIKNRNSDLIITRIRQLNIIPKNVVSDITVEANSRNTTPQPKGAIVVTPALVYTIAGGIASVVAAVTAAVSIGVYLYVRTKGKRFSTGDFGSIKIYPQIGPILRQIIDMTDLNFAEKVDEELINLLCAEAKEYFRIHPDLDPEVSRDR